MLEARSAVKNLHAYRPPLAGRNGLRLDFNESLIGCSPRALARLRALDAATLARYPEREPVEAEIAAFLGLNQAQVLLTNGVDEAIHLLCSTYLDPNDEVILVAPTFAMYKLFAQSEGARVIEVLSDQDFYFPAKELLSRINERTRLIAIANPNNPTGTAVDCEVLRQIADAAPYAAILVDEAYFEFHGETMLSRSEWPENLFVARTFSKAYGLAGLRIGILAGNTAQMGMVRRVASPYNVNVAALAVLLEALRDQQYVDNYVAEVKRGREQLQQELETLGLRYWSSRANFVLVRIGPTHTEFVQSLRTRGILVRDRSSDPGCEGCVRLTVGSTEHVQILIDALRIVIEEIGLHREVKA
ncbi:MAG TPA: histidinol-phosphate transaminase [Candidatus Aquilonibacter sp.]|jgi:histidinol-phosphate aminotransferase|nr:histidinol-phosphate transaminase [Candidatus Aquilonibacter sp.]